MWKGVPNGAHQGTADRWCVARMLKTAPVSREMVLNFVARHTFGPPASY